MYLCNLLCKSENIIQVVEVWIYHRTEMIIRHHWLMTSQIRRRSNWFPLSPHVLKHCNTKERVACSSLNTSWCPAPCMLVDHMTSSWRIVYDIWSPQHDCSVLYWSVINFSLFSISWPTYDMLSENNPITFYKKPYSLQSFISIFWNIIEIIIYIFN